MLKQSLTKIEYVIFLQYPVSAQYDPTGQTGSVFAHKEAVY
jgi:hypothetical protein